MMWVAVEGETGAEPAIAAAAPHIVFRTMDAIDAYSREAGGWVPGDENHPPAADRVKALSPVFDELAKESEMLRKLDFRIPFERALKVLLAEADPQIRQNLGLSSKSK
jgi:hypothetical protein